MECLTKMVTDSNVSKLILDFAGLSWCLIRFPYPLTQDETARGAVSETLYSRFLSNTNVLLLGKAARGPFINIHDRWVFYACHLMKDFGQMWKYVKKWQKDNKFENNSANDMINTDKDNDKDKDATDTKSKKDKKDSSSNLTFYMNTNVLGTDSDMHQENLIDDVVKKSEEVDFKIRQQEFEQQLQQAREFITQHMRQNQ